MELRREPAPSQPGETPRDRLRFLCRPLRFIRLQTPSSLNATLHNSRAGVGSAITCSLRNNFKSVRRAPLLKATQTYSPSCADIYIPKSLPNGMKFHMVHFVGKSMDFGGRRACLLSATTLCISCKSSGLLFLIGTMGKATKIF